LKTARGCRLGFGLHYVAARRCGGLLCPPEPDAAGRSAGAAVGPRPRCAPWSPVSAAGWLAGVGSIVYTTYNVGIGLSSPTSKLQVWGGNLQVTGTDLNGTLVASSLAGVAYIGDNSLTNGIAINSSGCVGIGTTSPGATRYCFPPVRITAYINPPARLPATAGALMLPENSSGGNFRAAVRSSPSSSGANVWLHDDRQESPN